MWCLLPFWRGLASWSALFVTFFLAAAVNAREVGKIEIVPTMPHTSAITSVAFSPDGRRLLSGSKDNTLKLWDAATGQLIRTFVGHSNAVWSVAFSPDGTRLLSGSADNTLRLWDAATGQLLRSFEGHSGWVLSVAFSPDGTRVASSSSDKTLKLWDGATGGIIRSFEGQSGGSRSVAFSPDGMHLLSANGERTLKLWDIATGQLIRNFEGAGNSVVFSPDGKRVLSGNKLWDAATGQIIRTYEKADSAIAFSPDGKRFLTVYGNMLRLWDVGTAEMIRSFEGHMSEVLSAAFSPDGTWVLSGSGSLRDPYSKDDTLKLWDADTGQLLHTTEARTYPIWSVAFSPDGALALSGSKDKALKLFDVATGQLLRTYLGHSNSVWSVAFSPDGTRAVSGSADKTVKLWDVATGRVLHTLEGHSNEVHSVAFSPDGTRVVSGGWDGTLKLWDATTGQLLLTISTGGCAVDSVTFSPDATQLLSGNCAINLWNAATGQLIRTFDGHSDRVGSVAFSPDGQRVLSGGRDDSGGDNTLKLWDIGTGQLLHVLNGHSAWVGSVAFSPDGQRVLSGSDDRTLKLWDASTGQLINQYEGHSDWVNSVAFSPDGMHLLSGSEDTTIRIWNSVGAETALVSLLAATDGDWLAITAEGFFAASPNGAKMLSIVEGLDVYSIHQFYQKLYRPDLVREKLAVGRTTASLDIAELLNTGRVPMVRITSHKASDISPTDLVIVEGTITGRGGGIGRAEWRINGITVGVVKVDTPVPEITLRQPIALDPGENSIELVAYNGGNAIASAPARAKIVWTGSEASVPPRMHVVAIGINDYWDGKLKLAYAVPDAKSIVWALKAAGKELYEDVIVTEILDGDATVQHLEQVFADLSRRIRPRDVFVFYAAGHGITQDGRYYFIPHDFKYLTDKSYGEHAIGQDRLQVWFAKIPAKKSIVIFDTCESGSLTTVQLASVRGGFEQLAAVGRLIEATGRTTLTAALDNQPALEGYRGHGVFTFAMLDALARGDRNGDGLISVTELIEHVDGLVPEITFKTWGVRQLPRYMTQGTNFALGKQVSSIAPAPSGELVISTKPTHINSELLRVFKEPGGKGIVVQQLAPFTPVTMVRTEQGWVLIAKDGKALGYVGAVMLHKLN